MKQFSSYLRLTTLGFLVGVFLTSACAPVSQPPPQSPSAPVPQSTSAQPPASPAPPRPAVPAVQQPPAPTVAPVAPTELPRRGGVLRVVWHVRISHYDFYQDPRSGTLPVTVAYSGLVAFDQLDGSKVVPDLAQSWDLSGDGKTYTFKLRSGVQWHDRKPLTAEDARFSIERIVQPPKGIVVPFRELLAAIDKVETPDASTVKVILKHPSGSFLPALALTPMRIQPKHVVTDKGDMKKVIVGTGAFKFKTETPSVSFELERNPNYFVQGQPYLDGIKYFIILDPTTAFAAFRSHQAHVTNMTWTTESQEKAIAEQLPGASVLRYPLLSAYYVNVNVTQKPWSDVRVRRAVNLAIDRQAAIKVLHEGLGSVAGFMPPGSQWATPEAELLKRPGYRQPKGPDIAEAKRLLADAGYPNGFKTKLFLRDELPWVNFATFMKNELAKLEITADIEAVTAAEWVKRASKGDYEIGTEPSSMTFDQPESYVGKSLRPEELGFRDPKLEDIFEALSRAADVAVRQRLVREMEDRLFDTLPQIPAVEKPSRMGVWKEVKGFGPPVGVYGFHTYRAVWLAQ